MSNCKRFREMVSDYIEGELSGEDKIHFENHIKECSICSEITAKMRLLQNDLCSLKLIQASPDFDTILRTRIRIESGIGRRRLHEIIWNWPAKIPVYGMSLALIIIAFVLVAEQINQPYQSLKPDPYVNTEWYGGNPNQNNSSVMMDETENFIYVIERTSPDKLFNNNEPFLRSSSGDSVNKTNADSISFLNRQIKPVNQVTF